MVVIFALVLFESAESAWRLVLPSRHRLPASKNSLDQLKQRLGVMPSRRQSSAMAASSPRPSKTMRISSSAGNLRRGFHLIARTIYAGSGFLSMGHTVGREKLPQRVH